MKGTIWCMHGAVGQSADWQGLSVPGWAVRRVDLWRFVACCPMPLADFGRALNEEARATPGPRVLLGYSMGGRLALHALLEKDSPWDAAVIVSAHPGLESEEERAARRAADAEWAARALQMDWPDFLKAWNAQPVLGGAAAGMADRRLLSTRKQEVARSFMDWSLGAQEPLWERLSEIKVPVLWVVGGCDEKFRKLGERAVSGIPVAEGVVIENAGHRVPWEAATEFSEVVGDFLIKGAENCAG
jgi:2-succinyl-6-hydroxy-2,4-cyclohexadiene-1-carboxylate synthase